MQYWSLPDDYWRGRSRGSGTWKWRNSSFTQPKCTLSQHESLRWEKESAVWMNSLRVVRKALLTYRLQFERKIAETGWPAQTHLIIWWLLLCMLIIGNPNKHRVSSKSYPCGRWFQAHDLVFHHGTWTRATKCIRNLSQTAGPNYPSQPVQLTGFAGFSHLYSTHLDTLGTCLCKEA